MVIYKTTNLVNGKIYVGLHTKSKPCSEETRLKISIANTGRKSSEEFKKKISLSVIGQKRALGCMWSDDAKQRCVERHKNQIHPKAFSTKVVRIVDGEIKFFKSANDARKYLECHIQKVLNNKLNGYIITRDEQRTATF